MPIQHILILNGGGLRSLVATALWISESPNARVSFMHVQDGRENAPARQAAAQRQAEHFNIKRVSKLNLPHLFAYGQGKQPDGRPMGLLAKPQMLLAATTGARIQQASTLVWPAAYDAQPDAVATASEQVLLVNQLGQLEAEQMPHLEAPLLEMTDQQILELGHHLQLDWRLAWSCLFSQSSPCQMCPACARRRNAFAKAGLTDPTAAATT